MLGSKYLIYAKMALSGIKAVKQAIVEAKSDGVVTTEEKFIIALAFFMGLFASVIGDE